LIRVVRRKIGERALSKRQQKRGASKDVFAYVLTDRPYDGETTYHGTFKPVTVSVKDGQVQPDRTGERPLPARKQEAPVKDNSTRLVTYEPVGEPAAAVIAICFDPALMRPGRFSTMIDLQLPNAEDRAKLAAG
jgi:hypothetical protein